ncbi:hypothetical protein yfred0001_26520 [Yersinia frederiksenii ATCC 33641]|nr:hypothetical protein yfred0001_26520 [Yersinia frederiksenii ATCC 33641]
MDRSIRQIRIKKMPISFHQLAFYRSLYYNFINQWINNP